MAINLKENFYYTISDSLSYKLNVTRAIAALLVMLGHLRSSWFVPYADLTTNTKGVINLVLFFVTRIGHECVIVFFVLSGFLVGGSAIADFLKDKFSIQKYFISRFSRMWAVVIPTLVLGWFVDIQTLHLDSTLSFADKLTPTIFMGNVFFMQTLLVPTFGSNEPLWSLANEFWYYLIFPVFMLLLTSKMQKFAKWIALLLFVVLICTLIPNMMKFFPIWLMGACIRLLPSSKIFKIKYLDFVFLILLAGSIAYSNLTENLWANYLVAIVFSFTLICWMNKSVTIRENNVKGVIETVADFSFSMYAIHYFLIYYLIAYLQKQNFPILYKEASLVNWLTYLLAAFALMVISFCFYWLLEKRTIVLRNFLTRLLSKIS